MPVRPKTGHRAYRRLGWWCRAAIVASASLLGACSTDSLQAPERRDERPLAPLTPSRAFAGACDYAPTDAEIAGAGWRRVFVDEFDGSLSQWSIWSGGAFNNELQHYRPENLSVANGILSIAARRETVTGATTPFDPTPKTFDYTSGRIESKTHFSASRTTPQVRMVARLKLPTGYGMWPAFWSYGDPWPTQGEIDIMEGRGHEPFQYNTAYWYGRRSGVNLVGNSAVTVPVASSLTDCWHVYDVTWTQNDLTFRFDGQNVDVKSGGYIPSMWRKQQRVTLNLAVGGLFFPNFDPSQVQVGTLQVDWVKVFVR